MIASRQYEQTLALTVGTTATGAVRISHETRFSLISPVGAGFTGTFVVQGSNNAFKEDGHENNENTSATWADIAGSSQSITGSAATISYNTSDAAYGAYRLKYTGTVGTGSAPVYGYIKGT